MMQKVIVLRYGHRFVRDYRVTSHCCLVARAFGAEKVIIEGDGDASSRTSVEDIVKRWGGKFKVEFTASWEKTIKELKKKGFIVVHLTMYGEEILKKIKKINKVNKILVIIGSQKVERKVYELSDYNICVTQQPHSEIAALAVFLDRFFEGKEFKKKFSGAKIKIIPSARGKNVVSC